MSAQPESDAAVATETGSAVVRVMPSGLGIAGLLMLVLGAWGGIVAFVGPTFGFGAGASPAWTWNLAHFLVGLVPGVAAVLAGLFVLGRLGSAAVGEGRFGVALAGLLAMLAGAWFTIAPQAWAVLYDGLYFLPASHLRQLADEGGYAVGPGALIAMSGAFALGWALSAHGGARVFAFVPRSSKGRHHLRSTSSTGVAS